MSLSFSEVLARFGTFKQHGKEYRVRCPSHDDHTPSLDIAEGAVGPLFQCRSAGCSSSDILAAVGLTWGDVLPQHNGHQAHWDAVHEYHDRDGILRYRVYRRGAGKSKVILQQAANGAWNLKGVKPLPYRLPHLKGPTIFVVEGEKAADALWRIGYEATCNSGGAGKWRESDTAALKDAGITGIVILPDNDEAGAAHAAQVEASAQAVGIDARRVTLPGLPLSGDAYDWLQTHTADDLAAAIKPAPPVLLEELSDATDVAAEGRKLAEEGIPYIIEGILPDYAGFGLITAQAKVGKSTLGLFLAACVASESEFLGRAVMNCRVLVIAAEDPPPYVAYLARHLTVPAGRITFSRAPIQLNTEGLTRISNTIAAGNYGLVLIASWQAVVSSLVKDENDNAGSVAVVEAVKRAARASGVMWLADAHAGKGEDQTDDADPTKAMRGASAAAGAADFLLNLRYLEKDTFSTKRRLSGKGRFVNLPPMVIDYDDHTGRYTLIEEAKSPMSETTWLLIQEMGAINEEWAGVGVIAFRAGLTESSHKVTGAARRTVSKTLHNRAGTVGTGVERRQSENRGRLVWEFRRVATDEGF